jgi:predicted regulator of Ras-like GTPase activity (Roadblock/LC7/MglB family)
LFTGLLNQVVSRVEGADAALIAGMDGIIVERAAKAEAQDLDGLAVEYATLLRRSRHAADDTGLGELQEMLAVTDRHVLLVKLLSNDYFVLLALPPETNVGRARYELRRAQLLLQPEFAA